MIADFTPIRLIGLLLAIAFVAYFYIDLRVHKKDRAPAFLSLFSGFLLLLISIFPAITYIPAELFSLADIKGGRLVTLLMIAVAILWIAVMWERYKTAYIRKRLNDFLKSYALDKFHNKYADEFSIHSDDIWVVIPALNEEESLPWVLNEMPNELFGHKVSVLIVNDGSADNTGLVSEQHGAWVIDMPISTGGGSALSTGYAAVLKAGAKYVVTIDADGQNEPNEMAGVIKPILDNEADVVIGSRILGLHEHTSVARTVGVPFFNTLLSLMLGKKITDCASNYRAFNSKVLENVTLIQEQYHTAEMLIEVSKRNYRITESPISFRRRKAGHTKKGKSLFYGAFFLRTILKTWLR